MRTILLPLVSYARIWCTGLDLGGRILLDNVSAKNNIPAREDMPMNNNTFIELKTPEGHLEDALTRLLRS
jgi:hypothetical protein